IAHSVGATGFEPATSCSRSRRSTGLSYAPMFSCGFRDRRTPKYTGRRGIPIPRVVTAPVRDPSTVPAQERAARGSGHSRPLFASDDSWRRAHCTSRSRAGCAASCARARDEHTHQRVVDTPRRLVVKLEDDRIRVPAVLAGGGGQVFDHTCTDVSAETDIPRPVLAALTRRVALVIEPFDRAVTGPAL